MGWGIQKLDFDCKLAANYSLIYSSQTSNNLGLESMNFWAPIVDSSKQLAIWNRSGKRPIVVLVAQGSLEAGNTDEIGGIARRQK